MPDPLVSEQATLNETVNDLPTPERLAALDRLREIAELRVEPRKLAKNSLHDKAKTALDSNAEYLAITDPTAAQARAQTAKLTRQVNGIIRILLRDFDADTEV